MAISAISRALFAFVAVGAGLWMLTLGVALWQLRGTEARERLRDDLDAIRGRDIWAWGLVVIETLLSLGLVVRACFHTLIYLTSGLGDTPDVSLRLRWAPLSDQPVWNEWSARLFTAVCGLWLVQAVSVGWGWPPLVEQALRIVFTANAALLVGDPVVGAAQRLLDSTMTQPATNSDRGEQHG